MSNITEKRKIKGYSCTINWFCVGRFDSLTITIEHFEKVDGLTTARKYVEKQLGIESLATDGKNVIGEKSNENKKPQ